MLHGHQLRIPGPTTVPERVARASTRPMIDHRSAEFTSVLDDCRKGVQWALQTDNDVLVFPASGSGGLEAAVANLLSPGEPAVFCTAGWFGQTWADIAAAYRVDVVRVDAPWGEPLDARALDRTLGERPDITKVFLTHNETSTGVVNDLPALAEIVKGHGRLLAIDTIGGGLCQPIGVDELAADVVVSCSQKGFLAPPGLAMIAVSPAGLRATETSTCPRWYFDFAAQKACHDVGRTLSTPALSVLYALQEGLAILEEEGLEQVWARHRTAATMIRAGIEAMGLRLFAKAGYRSDTVTVVRSPFVSPDDHSAFLRDLDAEYGLALADGHDRMRGRIFRIGHLGAVVGDDAYAILARLENALEAYGITVDGEPGAALRAARLAAHRSAWSPTIAEVA